MNKEDKDRVKSNPHCNLDWDCMNMDCKKIGLMVLIILIATMMLMLVPCQSPAT